MIEFIKDNLAVIAVAAVVVIFLIRFGRTIVARLRLSGQIDREGVAADAVVSRVVIERDLHRRCRCGAGVPSGRRRHRRIRGRRPAADPLSPRPIRPGQAREGLREDKHHPAKPALPL